MVSQVGSILWRLRPSSRTGATARAVRRRSSTTRAPFTAPPAASRSTRTSSDCERARPRRGGQDPSRSPCRRAGCRPLGSRRRLHGRGRGAPRDATPRAPRGDGPRGRTGQFLGGLADTYGPNGNATINFYWEARLPEARPADDIAELAWFPADALPPRDEFAFANTVELLERVGASSPSVGPLLALTASLSWGLGDFLAGLRTRRLPVVTVLVVSQAAGLSTIALVVAIRGIGPPDGRYLFFGSLAGVAGAVGLAALYRGLAVGPMSVVAPISGTAAVVPVVAGVVTGERPSAAQAAGIALAVVGVVLASRAHASHGGHQGEPRAPAWRSSQRWLSASYWLPWVRRARGSVLGHFRHEGTSFSLLVLTALVLRPSFALRERDLPVLLLIGVLDTAGNALFAVATTKSLLALAAVLAALPGGDRAAGPAPSRRAHLAGTGRRRGERVRRRRAHHRRIGRTAHASLADKRRTWTGHTRSKITWATTGSTPGLRRASTLVERFSAAMRRSTPSSKTE